MGAIQKALEIVIVAFVAKLLCQGFKMYKLMQFIEILAMVIVAVLIFGEFTHLAEIFDKIDKMFK